MPTVSIITPLYNASAYIAETIQSVKAQTHGNWEMIIADDGSTDESVAVARDSAGNDPRIRIFEFPASGLPAIARNRALAHATGEFIAFLDADDLFEPERLAKQLEAMGEAAWSFCNTRHFQEGAASPPWIHFPAGWTPGRPYFDDVLTSSLGLPIHAVIARREALLAVSPSGRLDDLFDTAPPDQAVVEDWDLILRLARHAEPVYTPKVLVRYRHHAAGVSKAGERPFVRALRTIEKMRREGAPADLCRRAERMQQSKRAIARLLSGQPHWRRILLGSTLPPGGSRDLFFASLACLPSPLARRLYTAALESQAKNKPS